MPICDKPTWIQHGGAAIQGVDIDPSGQRIATCGNDNKVRIWSMRPVLSEAAEQDPAVPKQLALLGDSTTPVNCVRFAPSGRLLASGSDDADCYIYEMHEGRGTAVFGSGEAANIENWRLKSRLRGHVTNVADIAWAPDSRRLATCSVDNKVKVWEVSSGHCIRTLEGHMGHVKGVAWDPFDFFLASQGDREVIVWRLEDGEQVARITEPFVNAPIVSFALRPSWSPDGQTLALPNGLDKGMHIVSLLRRNVWTTYDFSLVGHTGPVTAVRYNPHLYYPPRVKQADGTAAAAAAPADGDAGVDEDSVGGVVTVGSTDKRFSLWHQALDQPSLICKRFFKSLINDFAWTPDGRVLVAASYDGSIAALVFDEGDLGRRVPEAEVQQLLSQLYGDPRLRNQKSALTAAPDLLQLEARARADVEREERLNSRLGAGAGAGPGPVPPPSSGAAGPLARPPLVQGNGGPNPAAAATGTAAAAAAATRPPGAAPSSLGPARIQVGGPRPPSPAKTAGAAAAAAARGVGAAAAGAGPSGRDPDQPPAKRVAVQPAGSAGGPAGARMAPGAAAPSSLGGRPLGGNLGGAAADGAGAPGVGPAGPGAGGAAVPVPPAVLVPPDPVKPHMAILIHAQTGKPGEPQIPLELQALNTGHDARNRPTAELVCLAGGSRQWGDAVQGHIVAMAGSSRLAAVSTSQGDLMVYSPAGRRLFPPIRLSGPAAFLSVAAGSSLLLALLSDGQLRLWDFAAGEVLLDTSVAPLLLAGGGQPPRVTSARISSSGSPVLVLSNAHAYVHHAGLRSWVRVADDAFPASAYATNLTAASTGELSRLQSAAAQRRNPHDVLAAAAAHAGRPAAAARSEQALLEHNLAAAAALQSAAEWRLWLVTYVRRLAADEDEPRLRELISELMGPLRWSPASHPPASATTTLPGAPGLGLGLGRSMSGGSAGAAGAAPFGSEPPALACSLLGPGRWSPCFLGLDKRRLLREVVLKEVAKNRAFQQLVAEVLDQLRRLEGPPQQHQAAARMGSGAGAALGAAVAGPQGAGHGAAGLGPSRQLHMQQQQLHPQQQYPRQQQQQQQPQAVQQQPQQQQHTEHMCIG